MQSEDVGQALALLRAEKGLSQREMAARMGLARDTSISSIETGNPTSRVVSSYLSALGLDYHALARALDIVGARAGAMAGDEIREVAEDELDSKVEQFKQALDDVVLAIREKHAKR